MIERVQTIVIIYLCNQKEKKINIASKKGGGGSLKNTTLLDMREEGVKKSEKNYDVFYQRPQIL